MKRPVSLPIRTHALCCGALFALILAGCAEAPSEPLLSVEYTGWRQSTSMQLDFPVPGHGAGLRRIFVNDIGFETAPAADGSIIYPDGTIFIKEVYADPAPADGASPMMLTAMVKNATHEDALEGWIWVMRDPASGEETRVTDSYCLTCHANANEEHPYGTGNGEEAFRDFIFHAPALEAEIATNEEQTER